jgi:hypothetical protein
MYIPGPFDWISSWRQKRHLSKLEYSMRVVSELGMLPLVERLNLTPGAINIMVTKPGMLNKLQAWAVWYFCKIRGISFFTVVVPTLDLFSVIISRTKEEVEADLAAAERAKEEGGQQ